MPEAERERRKGSGGGRGKDKNKMKVRRKKKGKTLLPFFVHWFLTEGGGGILLQCLAR